MNVYYRRGWTDRMEGKPLHEYRKKAIARQYELGRRDAAIAQARNHNEPTPPITLFDLPAEVSREIAQDRRLLKEIT